MIMRPPCLLLVALAALAGGCSEKSKASEPPKEGGKGGGARPVPVQTAVAEKRDVPVWLDGLGSVAAWKQVTVRAQVDGRLEQVFFKEGQAVKAGDPLAQIDPRPFQVQLHQAEGALARDKAQLENNKVNLKRYNDLRKTSLVAQQQVDDQAAQVGVSEGAVLVDQAAVESARLNLDYARVRAPFDGVVGVRQVDPGNLVHASDPNGIVVLTQLDPAAVLFTLPQDELPRIAAAQAKEALTVEAWSRDGQTRLAVGKLAVIDNQINQATSTVKLKALFANPQRALWPNQFVKARLLVDVRKGALVVPAPALQRGPQGTFVYAVGGDQTAVVKPVKVAVTSGELAVIEEGLAPGDTVVVEGQNQLRAGAPLQLRAGGPPKGDRPKGDRPPQPPAPLAK